MILTWLTLCWASAFFLQILVQRLKVPPSINQFSKTLDKNQATELLKVLVKYQPEDKKAKQQRLKEIAAAKEAGKDPAPSKAPKVCTHAHPSCVCLLRTSWASLKTDTAS